jgi:hypothetical protein
MNRARFAKLDADTVEAGLRRVDVHHLTPEGGDYLAHSEFELDHGSDRQLISHLDGGPVEVQFQGPPESVDDGIFFPRIYIDKIQGTDPDSLSSFWFLSHGTHPTDNFIPFLPSRSNDFFGAQVVCDKVIIRPEWVCIRGRFPYGSSSAIMKPDVVT